MHIIYLVESFVHLHVQQILKQIGRLSHKFIFIYHILISVLFLF